MKEEERILKIVDQVAKNRGCDRSAIYREAMRFWLASNGFLTVEEKRALGVKVRETI